MLTDNGSNIPYLNLKITTLLSNSAIEKDPPNYNV